MSSPRTFWVLVISSAAIIAVTMGMCQSIGLFVSPINSATGLGIVAISFALAIGQFVWGAVQPLFGMLADRYGTYRVLVAGAILIAVSLCVTPLVSSGIGLVLVLGVLREAGAGAGTFAILFGAIARRLPPDRRSFASGFINAGGSFGQFAVAPVVQAIIIGSGWIAAVLALAVAALGTIILALPLRETGAARSAASAPSGPPLAEQLRLAFADRSYLCRHAGFFTCGFHLAFLITHLPGEVSLCGLPATVAASSISIIGLANVPDSIGAGWLGQHRRMKMILFRMYGFRALTVTAYLLAPKTPLTFYVFSVAIGLTWLATVPPTAGLVGKLFGPRHLATLFGLTLLSHQIGGFLGAWLGGVSFEASGNYMWLWYADIALATAAVNLPIREAHPRLHAAHASPDAGANPVLIPGTGLRMPMMTIASRYRLLQACGHMQQYHPTAHDPAVPAFHPLPRSLAR